VFCDETNRPLILASIGASVALHPYIHVSGSISSTYFLCKNVILLLDLATSMLKNYSKDQGLLFDTASAGSVSDLQSHAHHD